MRSAGLAGAVDERRSASGGTVGVATIPRAPGLDPRRSLCSPALRHGMLAHAAPSPDRTVNASILLAACAAFLSFAVRAAPVDVDADLIWNDKDAQGKCPALCSAKGLHWTGTWRKVGWTDRPVCACDDKAPPAAVPPHVSISIGMPGAASNALPPGAVTRIDNVAFPDNDLRFGSAPSFEQCAAQCLGTPDCAAFTFASDRGSCHQKVHAGATVAAGAAISGVVNRSGPVAGAAPPAPAAGPSCSVGGTAKCPGCSVTCAPGQTPVCEHAVEGVTSTCARNTSCRCNG